MVRLKTRWFIVQVDYPDQAEPSPGRKGLTQAIREQLEQSFGMSASGPALDTQVRFWDPTTRLAMIRTSREFCSKVRASITLMTLWNNQQVALHIVSVHGSARTAKIKAVRIVQRHYRHKILSQTKKIGESYTTKDTAKLCRTMEETLELILAIEF